MAPQTPCCSKNSSMLLGSTRTPHAAVHALHTKNRLHLGPAQRYVKDAGACAHTINMQHRRPRHRTRVTTRAIDESGILDVVGNVLGRKFQPETAVLASAFFALLSVVVNIFGGLITERKRADLVLEVITSSSSSSSSTCCA